MDEGVRHGCTQCLGVVQMAIDRSFRDINGIEWRVSQVSPNAASSDAEEGWLSFEAGMTERRLTPAPKNWESATIQRLEQMCRIATVTRRDESDSAPRHERSVRDVRAASVDAQKEVVSDVRAAERTAFDASHVSLLANVWPAHEARVSFRG